MSVGVEKMELSYQGSHLALIAPIVSCLHIYGMFYLGRAAAQSQDCGSRLRVGRKDPFSPLFWYVISRVSASPQDLRTEFLPKGPLEVLEGACECGGRESTGALQEEGVLRHVGEGAPQASLGAVRRGRD